LDSMFHRWSTLLGRYPHCMWRAPATLLAAICCERHKKKLVHQRCESKPSHASLSTFCSNWEELRRRYTEPLAQIAHGIDADSDAKAILQEFERTAQLIESAPLTVHGHWALDGKQPCEGTVVVLGTCHHSDESATRCRQAAQTLQPSCLILELCQERLLPVLACPTQHRAAWLCARIPQFIGNGIWDQFAVDQESCLAVQDGVDMSEAFDGVCHSATVPFLVALADVTQSESEIDDPGRDLLLARACMAAVAIGHRTVMLVTGADHVRAVADELLRWSDAAAESAAVSPLCAKATNCYKQDDTASKQALHLDGLGVELLSGEIARSWFLSPRAASAVFSLRQQIRNLISPEQIQALRAGCCTDGVTDVSSSDLRSFERKAGFRGTSNFLDDLEACGSAVQPASLGELQAWWHRESVSSQTQNVSN